MKGCAMGLPSRRPSPRRQWMLSWRVSYAVRGDELTVFVLEVNPHDYRKKD